MAYVSACLSHARRRSKDPIEDIPISTSSSEQVQVVHEFLELRGQGSTVFSEASSRSTAAASLQPLVAHMAVSSKGRWLAVAGPQRIHIFDINKLQYHCALPALQVAAHSHGTSCTPARQAPLTAFAPRS